VVVAHPDDEVHCAGTVAAQVALGDRAVLAWLTRGEMTEAFGRLPVEEVARRRELQGVEVARMLGAEARFLSFPDTGLRGSLEETHAVARLIADVRPDGLITWGDAWVRGARHPDHQAAGRVARDAITLARIARQVEPLAPHRGFCPVFTFRDVHSTLPAVAVDVGPHWEKVREVAAFYRERIGFGDPVWLERRLRDAGRAFGLGRAEVFDAWETRPGVVTALLPAEPADYGQYPGGGPARPADPLM
jgi:LmbE family N-acetylglucosaminyl deacetylase